MGGVVPGGGEPQLGSSRGSRGRGRGAADHAMDTRPERSRNGRRAISQPVLRRCRFTINFNNTHSLYGTG